MTAALWFFLGAGGCSTVMLLEPSLLEEGFALEIGKRILNGDHLYRDVVAFTGPLPFEWLGLLFRIFGEQLIPARLTVMLLHGAATCSVYVIARSATAGSFAHLAAALLAIAPIILFPLLSTYFYTTLSFSLALIACAATLRGTKSSRSAFTAGVIVALVSLCKQTVGLTLAPALGVALLVNSSASLRSSVMKAFCGGGTSVILVVLATYLARGELGILIQSLVWLPLSFDPSFSLAYMNFWPLGEFSKEVDASKLFYMPYFYSLIHGVWVAPGRGVIFFTQMLYALPIVALAATLLRRCFTPLPTACWIHFGALLSLMANVIPRTDWGHLVFVLPSACVQLVLLFAGAPDTRPSATARAEESAAGTSRGLGRHRTRALVVALALIGCVAAAGSSLALLYGLATPASLGPKVPLLSVNEGLRKPEVARAIQYLRARLSPGEPIFVARSEPLLYFATDARNPTPYGGLIPGLRDEQSRVIVDALRHVRYVVMSEIDQPVYTYYSHELPAVQAYLERHFTIPPRLLTSHMPPWLVVLERSKDRGETIFDLVDLQEQARPFVRESRGSVAAAAHHEGPLSNRLNRRFLAFELGRHGGGLDFYLTLPTGAVFQADVAYTDCATRGGLFKHPEPATLRVSIALQDDAEDFVRLVETGRQLFPLTRPKRWIPIEANLAAYAGQQIVLRLELIPEEPLPGGDLGWFGSPRIALSQ